MTTSPTSKVSARRLVGYGFAALATASAGTWILAEVATPDGVGVLTADLSGLGRTVGLIAAAAVGVPAAVLAYHRQRALDTANTVASHQHQLAADEHKHKVLIDEREHNLALERHLRDRYTKAAEQLGHDSAAIRMAGVYALASLEEDWRRSGNARERQVCVDLLCAYLRTTRPTSDESVIAQEKQVRSAIIAILKERRKTTTSTKTGTWNDLRINLAGADLTDADLGTTNLSRAELSDANLTGAYLAEAQLVMALMNEANLTNADLEGADLTDAHLSDVNLTGADLRKANLTDAWMPGADLTDAELDGADLTGIGYIDVTWPANFDPPPSAI